MKIKTIILLAVSWILSTIALIMFTGYIGIPQQQNIIIITVGLGLYWMFMAFLFRVGVLHFGHGWIVAGLFLILTGAVFVIGGNYNQKWWMLSIPQLGIFTIGFILGAIFLIFGLVQMWRNQYFLMRRK